MTDTCGSALNGSQHIGHTPKKSRRRAVRCSACAHCAAVSVGPLLPTATPEPPGVACGRRRGGLRLAGGRLAKQGAAGFCRCSKGHTLQGAAGLRSFPLAPCSREVDAAGRHTMTIMHPCPLQQEG